MCGDEAGLAEVGAMRQTPEQEESFWSRVDFDMRLRGVTNEALAHRLLDVSLVIDDDEASALVDEARRRLLVWTATPEEIDRQEEAQVEAIIAAMTPEERAEQDRRNADIVEQMKKQLEG